MADILAMILLAIIIGGAVAYIIKSKKKGVHCIGCPAGGQCCGCHSAKKEG